MIVEMSKGRQITIPAFIRTQLKLSSGSKLELECKQNTIILKPAGQDVKEIFNLAKNVNPKHKLTAKEMDKLNEGLLR